MPNRDQRSRDSERLWTGKASSSPKMGCHIMRSAAGAGRCWQALARAGRCWQVLAGARARWQ
eukprot:15396592-Alexandrium_andersonii.AAC.1